MAVSAHIPASSGAWGPGFWYGRVEAWFAVASFALLVMPSVPPVRGLGSVSMWVKPYYYVNYQDLGFIKRGLVGTGYKALGLSAALAPAATVVVSHVLLSLLAAVSFWLLASLAFSSWSLRQRLPLYWAMLLSPALFARLGFDTGRMDLWCTVLAIWTMTTILFAPLTPVSLSALVGLSVSVQMLIHDASTLYFAPLLVAVCWYRVVDVRQKTAGIWHLMPMLLMPGLTAAALLACGCYEPGQPALDRYLAAVSPDLEGGMPFELTATMAENASMSLGRLTPRSFFGGHVAVLAYFVLSVLFVVTSVAMPWWVKAAPWTPLLVSFLAWDSVRFLGVAVMAGCLLVVAAARFGKLTISPGAVPWLWGSSSAMFLGPWGIVPWDPLPWLRYFNPLGL